METIPQTNDENLVDQAAHSADRALDATRRVTGQAINRVADKVHDIRGVVSPILDRVVSPFEVVARHTREAPLRSLLAAAASGAALAALFARFGRAHR